jgi:hypothetical protein
MKNDMWIEPVVIADETFYFIYDYNSDVTSEELLVTKSLESAIEHCDKSNLTWEIVSHE